MDKYNTYYSLILKKIRLFKFSNTSFVFCLGFVALLSFVIGSQINFQKKWYISDYFAVSSFLRSNTKNKLEIHKNSDPKKVYESIFVNLNSKLYDVPKKRKGAGGGLTSFGTDLILLTHDGSLFQIHNEKLSKLKITLPDNGFEKLIKKSKTDRYKDYQFVFEWFRYNGILYFEDRGKKSLVISYTNWNDTQECFTTTIAQLSLPRNTTELSDILLSENDWNIIYSTQPCLPLKKKLRAFEGHMAGGRIVYVGNNHILLASGDYSFDGVYADQKLSQLTNNDYGKVLEIDLINHSARQLARGLRNMQGIAIDNENRIWTVEHGPRGGDELNLIYEGGNYGWPEVTLGTQYNNLPWPGSGAYGRHDGYDQPIFAWLPSIGVSSLTVINAMHQAWDGDLLAGSLRAQSLFRIRIIDGRALFTEQIHIGKRIRAVHQHYPSQLAIWTDDYKLIILTVSDKQSSDVFVESKIAELDLESDLKLRVKEHLERCSQCHSYDRYENNHAPSLGRVYGAKIASSSYSNYSKSLKSKEGTWTKDALIEYLLDVNKFANGTSMPETNIKDYKELEALVTVLSKLSQEAE